MTTGIKNHKHYTNICGVAFLLSVFICLPEVRVSAQITEGGEPWVVVIDPGHGGHDPGAVSKNIEEEDITLAIALKLGKYIETLDNVKVLYTRKTDVFVDLDKRSKFANDNNASVFISIHANWTESSKVKGTETWVMGPHKNEQNLQVAMKENSVITLEKDFSTKYQNFNPESPESYIIFSVMQKEYSAQSLEFASLVQDQFRTRAGRTDRSVKQAGFMVLWGTSMPSILVETGFITNPDEGKFLVSGEGQDLIASAIFRAFRDYRNTIDKKSSFIAGNEESVADETVTSKEEISFRVQIASSSVRKKSDPETFGGLDSITEINDGERFKYATGNFSSYDEAVSYRKKVVEQYPDAFVVAVKDNKILPLQEALEITRKQ